MDFVDEVRARSTRLAKCIEHPFAEKILLTRPELPSQTAGMSQSTAADGCDIIGASPISSFCTPVHVYSGSSRSGRQGGRV